VYNLNYTPTTLGVQRWREITSGGTRTKISLENIQSILSSHCTCQGWIPQQAQNGEQQDWCITSWQELGPTYLYEGYRRIFYRGYGWNFPPVYSAYTSMGLCTAVSARISYWVQYRYWKHNLRIQHSQRHNPPLDTSFFNEIWLLPHEPLQYYLPMSFSIFQSGSFPWSSHINILYASLHSSSSHTSFLITFSLTKSSNGENGKCVPVLN
jgi:hypothetical protein